MNKKKNRKRNRVNRYNPNSRMKKPSCTKAGWYTYNGERRQKYRIYYRGSVLLQSTNPRVDIHEEYDKLISLHNEDENWLETIKRWRNANRYKVDFVGMTEDLKPRYAVLNNENKILKEFASEEEANSYLKICQKNYV